MRLLNFLIDESFKTKVDVNFKAYNHNNLFIGIFKAGDLTWKCEIERKFGCILDIRYDRLGSDNYTRKTDFGRFIGLVFSGVCSCVEEVFTILPEDIITVMTWSTIYPDLVELYDSERIRKALLNRFPNYKFESKKEKQQIDDNGQPVTQYIWKFVRKGS